MGENLSFLSENRFSGFREPFKTFLSAISFNILSPPPAYAVKNMKDYIEERAVAIANYIIDHNATVRQTAKKFGISKSTVHKDVTDRLEHINPSLAAQARVVLDVNKSERHIRGGLATREKYQHRLAICSKQDD